MVVMGHRAIRVAQHADAAMGMLLARSHCDRAGSTRTLRVLPGSLWRRLVPADRLNQVLVLAGHGEELEPVVESGIRRDRRLARRRLLALGAKAEGAGHLDVPDVTRVHEQHDLLDARHEVAAADAVVVKVVRLEEVVKDDPLARRLPAQHRELADGRRRALPARDDRVRHAAWRRRCGTGEGGHGGEHRRGGEGRYARKELPPRSARA
mmetsp:Transcript_9434/g.29779  ORF Transcript_9434/g.29779 Transcript_9434/m.29779 type:complete len:209 (+) Transcript_9434:427-1053(+)